MAEIGIGVRMRKLGLYIWGTGKKYKTVRAAINDNECELLGLIDNNPAKRHEMIDSFEVTTLGEIKNEYDYIIISVVKYEAIVFQIAEAEISDKKVICYFSFEDYERFKDCNLIDTKQWKIDILEEKLIRLEHLFEIRNRNTPYELADSVLNKKYKFPKIRNNEETIKKLCNGYSIIRFGDGEFNIISGKNHRCFQNCTEELKNSLKEILQSNADHLLIALAPNYGDLSCYPEETSDGIREYMTDEVRELHMSLIDLDREYSDTYMFKCFIPHKDKENTIKRVESVKRIWEARDLLLIEGDKTRTGAGNDLLSNAKSVQRILCPTKNAYEVNDEILSTAKKTSKDKLILIALGPAGKVIAYGLFCEGYQVIDIGQIDMDYEWYLSGAGFKVGNKYKYVSQLPPAEVMDMDDEEYKVQIIAQINMKE